MASGRISLSNPYAHQVIFTQTAVNMARAAFHVVGHVDGNQTLKDLCAENATQLRHQLDAGHKTLQDLDKAMTLGVALVGHGASAALEQLRTAREAFVFLSRAVRQGEGLLVRHAQLSRS